MQPGYSQTAIRHVRAPAAFDQVVPPTLKWLVSGQGASKCMTYLDDRAYARSEVGSSSRTTTILSSTPGCSSALPSSSTCRASHALLSAVQERDTVIVPCKSVQ